MIIANINPDANQEYREDRAKKNGLMMQWVFVDEGGNKYDLDKTDAIWEHGSAQDFDYLLSTGSVVASGQKSKNVRKVVVNLQNLTQISRNLDQKDIKKGMTFFGEQ